MKRVEALDLRDGAPAWGTVTVEYSPDAVEHFDTRGEAHAMMGEASWGDRVAVTDGVLYLVTHSYGLNHTDTSRNILRNR